MGLADTLLAIGTGAGQGYISGELENRRRQEAEMQRQNSLLMGLAPYLQGRISPDMVQNMAPNNPTFQGLAPLISQRTKPVDIDEVNRLGKSILIADPTAEGGWRTPTFAEVYPVVKDPEAAMSTGRFKFREPASLLKPPAGKDPGVWRKAIEAASQVVMGDFTTMGMPYEEKMQAIINQAEVIYPKIEKMRIGNVPVKKKSLGPPTPNK